MILIEITVKGHVMWYQLLFSFKGKAFLFHMLPPCPPPKKKETHEPISKQPELQSLQTWLFSLSASMEKGGQCDLGRVG